jgi:hypothetical protein
MKKVTFGPEGKYESQVRKVMDQTGAQTVVLLVINGKKGTGLSARHRTGGLTPKEQVGLLRGMALAMDEGNALSGASFEIPDSDAEPPKGYDA